MTEILFRQGCRGDDIGVDMFDTVNSVYEYFTEMMRRPYSMAIVAQMELLNVLLQNIEQHELDEVWQKILSQMENKATDLKEQVIKSDMPNKIQASNEITQDIEILKLMRLYMTVKPKKQLSVAVRKP